MLNGPTDIEIRVWAMGVGLGIAGLLVWIERAMRKRCKVREDAIISAIMAERKADKPDFNRAIARAVGKATDTEEVRGEELLAK